MSAENSHLPRILCLHGGGTSELIFTFQARKLIGALRPYFRLVFVNAPFECGPGPGVVPVFEDVGPFYEWIAKKAEDEEQVRSVLQQKIDEDETPVVGVLGFSQGARIAAGLLEEQQNQALTPSLRFGVLFNGSYPPLRQPSNPSRMLPPLSEPAHSEWDDRHSGCIRLPSIHVHGTLDPALPRNRLLARCFDPDSATVLEFPNAHHLPLSDDENQQVVDEILRLHRLSRDPL